MHQAKKLPKRKQKKLQNLSKSYLAAKAKPLFDKRYKLQENLGEGAVSLVHRAKDLVTGQEVAVKIAKTGFDKEHMMHLFLNEIESLSLVDHPNIPKLWDIGLHNDLPYISMDLIKGKTVYQLFGASACPIHTLQGALKVFSQIADAVSALHNEGIVHRDLGPHNLLVDGLSVKIIDFGYAKVPLLPDYALQTNNLVGTLEVMAPEQTYPRKSVDHRADIYSLGVTMYMELVGDLPFPEQAPPAPFGLPIDPLILKHRYSPIVAVRDKMPYIPDHVAQTVERAIQKKPEDRFQSALEMKQAIDKSLSLLP